MKLEQIADIISLVVLCLVGHVTAIKCYGCHSALEAPANPCWDVSNLILFDHPETDYCMTMANRAFDEQTGMLTQSFLTRSWGSKDSAAGMQLMGKSGCLTSGAPGKIWGVVYTCNTDACNSARWSVEKLNFDGIAPCTNVY